MHSPSRHSALVAAVAALALQLGAPAAAAPAPRRVVPIKASSLPRARVHRQLRGRWRDIRACYQRALAVHPWLGLRVDIELVIAANGKVSAARLLRSTTKPARSGAVRQLIACMLSKAKTWRFSKLASQIVVRVPYIFRSSGLLPVAALTPRVRGTLDEKQVWRVARRSVSAVRACYRPLRWKISGGLIRVDGVVGRAGRFSRLAVRWRAMSARHGGQLASCLRRSAQKLRFPTSKGSTRVALRYALGQRQTTKKRKDKRSGRGGFLERWRRPRPQARPR